MLSKTFTYKPLRDDAARIDLLYFAVDTCDVGLGLAKQVYFLGRPAFTSRAAECPTSCVLTRPGGRVIFFFNRQFFDELGTEEIAFVTLHEAMHIAFRHAERRGKRDPVLWNVACDVVINELLLAQPQFRHAKSESFKRLIDSAATLVRFRDAIALGGPLAQFSAEVIYDRFMQHAGIRRLVRKLMNGLRPFHVDLSPNDMDPLAGRNAWEREQLARRLDRVIDGQRMDGWSLHESGELRQVQAVRGPQVPWDKVLLNRVGSMLREKQTEAWLPSRRLTALYPAVILPTEQAHEDPGKVSVLLAIDCSGSISRAALDRLVAVTRTIPRQQVEVRAVSFDVTAYPFDLEDRNSLPRGGGGTSFRCIEAYAAAMDRYPDLIVVLTDGAGEPPEPLHPRRWHWLLTPGGTGMYIHNIGSTTQIAM